MCVCGERSVNISYGKFLDVGDVEIEFVPFGEN
jgi:hypothetical protein